jgi:putative thioredoxin
MNSKDNPFSTPVGSGYGGSYGSGYGNANVSFGGTAATAPAVDQGATGLVAPAAVKDVTATSFRADVIEASKTAPVLVDFWAPWCGPCKQLAPLLEKVVAEAQGRVSLTKMNIDEHPSIAGQLGIQSIPAVIAFKNGQPVDGFMGAVPESEIRKFIDKIAGPEADPADEVLALVAEARGEGNLEAAAQLFLAALNQGIASPPIFAGLADTLLDLNDLQGAQEFLDQVPAEIRLDKTFTAVDAKLKLAQEVAKLGDPVALHARMDADPKDYQAQFDMSAIHNARGNRDAAADLLLAIMKADRAWQDDGARKRLLEYFEVWGFADEATLAARRKLSSVLFS